MSKVTPEQERIVAALDQGTKGLPEKALVHVQATDVAAVIAAYRSEKERAEVAEHAQIVPAVQS